MHSESHQPAVTLTRTRSPMPTLRPSSSWTNLSTYRPPLPPATRTEDLPYNTWVDSSDWSASPRKENNETYWQYRYRKLDGSTDVVNGTGNGYSSTTPNNSELSSVRRRHRTASPIAKQQLATYLVRDGKPNAGCIRSAPRSESAPALCHCLTVHCNGYHTYYGSTKCCCCDTNKHTNATYISYSRPLVTQERIARRQLEYDKAKYYEQQDFIKCHYRLGKQILTPIRGGLLLFY
jgi:hypothetical protein